MECDLCGETCRKSDAHEARDVGLVCPDCAEDMTECAECEMLFEPEEDGQKLCSSCRDEDAEEEDEGDAPPSPSADKVFRDEASHVLDVVARGTFYAELRRSDRELRLENEMPRLRAEIAAELAALDDAELTDWVRDRYYGSPDRFRTAAERRQRQQPSDEEIARRLAVFTAELRRILSA